MAATDERKPVTVLFADLKGSAELATQHDPEQLRALLSAFFDEMRQQQLGRSAEQPIEHASERGTPSGGLGHARKVPVRLPFSSMADVALFFEDPQHLRSAVATGATGYVAAPFTQERLLPALELAAARTTDLAALRADVVEIQNRLDTRKVVERAKGLLMAQQQLTEQEAFRLIQRTAMDRRTSMRDVAAAINNSLAGAA